jgi:hypothetical protein
MDDEAEGEALDYRPAPRTLIDAAAVDEGAENGPMGDEEGWASDGSEADGSDDENDLQPTTNEVRGALLLSILSGSSNHRVARPITEWLVQSPSGSWRTIPFETASCDR